MDRRNFLRTGGMVRSWFTGYAFAGYARVCARSIGGADSKSAVAAAANHFGVTEADLKK